MKSVFEACKVTTVALAVLSGSPAPAEGQRVIPDEIQCPDCLELVETQRVGDRPGFELFDSFGRWLARGSAGDLWVINYSIDDVIQVYDSAGAYEEFSKPGDGPGEFNRVQFLTCVDDQFLIAGLGRLLMIDPATRETQELSRVEKMLFAMGGNMIMVDDSVLWVSSPSRAPDLLGYPIIELDPFTGGVLDAYGKTVDHYDRMVERHIQRFLVPLTEDRIATVGEYAYEIRIYSTDGEELEHFVREAPWFPPHMSPGGAVAVTVAVVPLDSTRILVAALERDPRHPPQEYEGPSDLSRSERWNSVVEILDLESGSVLARRRLPHAITGSVCPTGELAAIAPTDRHPSMDHLRTFSIRWKER